MRRALDFAKVADALLDPVCRGVPFAFTDKGILSLVEASGGLQLQLRLNIFEVVVVVGVDFDELCIDLLRGASQGNWRSSRMGYNLPGDFDELVIAGRTMFSA